MRLLDTITGQFVEKDPKDQNFEYAILSHTWRQQEQTYQQLREIQRRHSLSGDVNTSEEYSSCDEGNPSHDNDPSNNANAYVSDHDSSYNAPSPQPLGSIWDDKKLSSKIREACKVARDNGYRYLWIDSCCIDKTSSSELSESINSMYQWYALADVCYAFLADVPADEDPQAKGSRFRQSRWFTRGWTLQELIAPLEVMFLAEDWTEIGSKVFLGDMVAEITKIDHDALLRIEPLEAFSIAQRFSWAADRRTTRVEDRAYSLLGILDINMPTLYGEGERAFRRLQEEIMRRTPDQSLFAWSKYGLLRSLSNSLPYHPERPAIAGYKLPLLVSQYEINPTLSLLSSSLNDFGTCDRIQTLSHDEVLRRLQLTADDFPARHYDFTPYGIRVQLPAIHFESSQYFPQGRLMTTEMQKECPPVSHWYLVILGCQHQDFPGCVLGRVCYIQPSAGSSVDFLYSGCIDCGASADYKRSELLPVSPETIRRLRVDSPGHASPKMLYIPQPPRKDEKALASGRPTQYKTINLVLTKKNREALSAQGYTATLYRSGGAHPTTHSVALVHDTHTITIDYQHDLSTGYAGYQTCTVMARVATSYRGLRGPESLISVSQGYAIWMYKISPQSLQRSPRAWDITLTVPEGRKLLLNVFFFTTNHFLLSIELNTSNLVRGR